MSEQNKALVQRMIEMFNAGEIDFVGEVCADDYVYHGPGIEKAGLDGLKELMSMYRGAFSDVTLTIVDQIAEGDKVVSYARASGTNDGAMGDIPASGNQIDIALIAIHRIEDGKIAEEWELFEELQMLQAMGVIPAMEEATV